MSNKIPKFEKRSIESIENKFNLTYALTSYERMWLEGFSTYEASARIQQAIARMLGYAGENEAMLEVGVGTGNSTIEFVLANPQLAYIIAVEPTSMVELLQLKISGDQTKEIQELFYSGQVSLEVLMSLGKRRKILNDAGAAGKILPVRAIGEELPVASASIDRMHMVQVLHWMAFAEKDRNGENVGYLSHALREFRRVLKTGQLLLFDSSGQQFKSGLSEYDDAHITRHPFYRACVEELYTILRQRGLLSSETLTPEKFSKNQDMFTIETLRELFSDAGFELVSFDEIPDLPQYALSNPTREYITYTILLPAEKIDEIFLQGGNMACFNTGDLVDVPIADRLAMLKQAHEIALQKYPTLRQELSVEVIYNFAARAV